MVDLDYLAIVMAHTKRRAVASPVCHRVPRGPVTRRRTEPLDFGRFHTQPATSSTFDAGSLARRLRNSRNGLQVIAVTGFNDEDDRLRSDEAGFSYHLPKPVDITAIHTAVQQLTPANDTEPG